MIKEHHLSTDAKMMLYLDCWSVHPSQKFQDWIKTEHPEIIVFYVPASCTGLFQPCDVGLQRLFKHTVKQSASQFFVDHIQRKQIHKTAPEDIRLPTKIGILRDATPLWIMNAIQYLNTPPLNSSDDPNYIGVSSWKNCKVGQWDLSYDSITFDIALSEWFKKSTEFRAEIEGSKLIITPLEIPLEEDNEEVVDGGDDEDIPMELSMLIVTGVDDRGLPTGYKYLRDGIVYDEAWDETAELLISDEVRKSEVEKSGIGRGKIKSSEVGDGQVQGSEVGESEVGESEVGESVVGESEVERIEVEKSEVENWEIVMWESETGENDTEESEDCN